MKEIDENVDVQEELIDVVEYDKLSGSAKNNTIYNVYNKCKTIKEKFDFLIELQVMCNMSFKKNGRPDDLMVGLNSLKNKFTEDYIVNGTHEQRQAVFEAVGARTGENEKDYARDKNRASIYVVEDPNKEEKDKKCTWFAKNGRFSIYEQVITEFNHDLMAKYEENANDEFSKVKLSTETTMKEFANICGFKGEDINKHLTKWNVTAKTKVGDYIKGYLESRGKSSTKDVIEAEMKKFMIDLQFINWREHGRKDYYASSKEKHNILDMAEKLSKLEPEEVEDESIEEWIQNEGKERHDNDIISFTDKCIRDFKEKHLVFKKRVKQAQPDSQKRAESIRQKYNSLKTIEEKFDYIMEATTYCRCLVDTEGMRFPSEQQVVDDLMYEFVDNYLINADIGTIKRTLNYYGKTQADIVMKIMEDEKQCKLSIDPDDPHIAKKAAYLARATKDGARLATFNIFRSRLVGTVYSNQDVKNKIKEAYNWSDDATMKDIADMLGYDEEKANAFYSRYGATANSNVLDAFRGYKAKEDNDKVENINDDDLKDFINNEIIVTVNDDLIKAGGDAKLKEAKFPKERMDEYKDVFVRSTTDASTSKIEDWVDNAGKELFDETTYKDYPIVVEEFEAKQNKETSFDNYIRLHIGANAVDKPGEIQKDYLAKAVAANLLKNAGGKYDVDKIHVMAENVKSMSEFDKIVSNHKDMLDALKSRNNIQATADRLTNSVYRLSSANVSEYVNDMNRLYKSLMPDKDRSKEYKAFYGVVEKIASLADRYEFHHEYDCKVAVKDLIDLNANLLEAVMNYTKGKKAVRWSDNGKERFNNTLDALGIMDKYVPGVKSQIDTVVARVNYVRWERNAVDLSKFGADRAEKAKVSRDAKKGPVKGKGMAK